VNLSSREFPPGRCGPNVAQKHLREKMIKVRVTAEEWAHICDLVAFYGMTVSTLTRTLLVKEATSLQPRPFAPIEIGEPLRLNEEAGIVYKRPRRKRKATR
jgi:hypothetical protein